VGTPGVRGTDPLRDERARRPDAQPGVADHATEDGRHPRNALNRPGAGTDDVSSGRTLGQFQASFATLWTAAVAHAHTKIPVTLPASPTRMVGQAVVNDWLRTKSSPVPALWDWGSLLETYVNSNVRVSGMGLAAAPAGHAAIANVSTDFAPAGTTPPTITGRLTGGPLAGRLRPDERVQREALVIGGRPAEGYAYGQFPLIGTGSVIGAMARTRSTAPAAGSTRRKAWRPRRCRPAE
jgi:hypothetical protein